MVQLLTSSLDEPPCMRWETGVGATPILRRSFQTQELIAPVVREGTLSLIPGKIGFQFKHSRFSSSSLGWPYSGCSANIHKVSSKTGPRRGSKPEKFSTRMVNGLGVSGTRTSSSIKVFASI
jgi:hypothetical protein